MYIKPLLKLLKKNTMSDDIRDSLSSMVKYIMHKDYILANEKYMEMAIGNAPWPIGVTNAGIHARPGRERIFSKHVAHVLNDESQRKYIQGLKRLMTKCQQYFVTDPSRSVDFQRKETDAAAEPRHESGQPRGGHSRGPHSHQEELSGLLSCTAERKPGYSHTHALRESLYLRKRSEPRHRAEAELPPHAHVLQLARTRQGACTGAIRPQDGGHGGRAP